MESLKKFLDKLRANNLTLRPNKCHFGMNEVKMLGYVLNQDGIMVDPDKTAAVVKMPAPTTPKLVRSFVGLVSYYRRFVLNFSKIAKPLTELTKHNVPFIWTPDC